MYFSVFSDGLSEMQDISGNNLEKEIYSIIDSNRSIDEMHEEIRLKVEEVNRQEGLDDDITFMLTRFLA